MGVQKFRGIWNCPALSLPVLGYECPQSWDALPATSDPAVRHCPACDRDVHLSRTPEEFVRAGEQGHCVAIPDAVRPIHLCGYQVGRPSAESVAAFRAELGRVVGWWSAVIERLPDSLGSQLEPMREVVERRRAEAEPGAAADGGGM